ncbi:MAG: Fic family protein, partial [Deltaproteobacteria bacterium]|nr:Fic family protein [Deltaproteobacteria bacterium]
MKTELVRRSIHGTAAIEGNPLDEKEVGRVIEEATRLEDLPRPEREIANI